MDPNSIENKPDQPKDTEASAENPANQSALLPEPEVPTKESFYFLKDLPEDYMTEADFQRLTSPETGDFKHVTRGTYVDKDEEYYMYVKGCHILEDKGTAEKALAVSRWFIRQGVLSPTTQVRIMETVDNNVPRYQLVFFSSNLENFNTSEELRQVMKENTAKGSIHIAEWYERVDPSFQDRSISFDEKPYTHILNISEAMHSNNWGREAGFLYPIDVEVIDFSVAPEVIDDVIKKFGIEV